MSLTYGNLQTNEQFQEILKEKLQDLEKEVNCCFLDPLWAEFGNPGGSHLAIPDNRNLQKVSITLMFLLHCMKSTSWSKSRLEEAKISLKWPLNRKKNTLMAPN